MMDAASQAYDLFRAGLDTRQIADRFRLHESEASQLVWIGRCRSRGLPAEFIKDKQVRQIEPAKAA